jgi:hypothetical protein
MIRSAGGCCKTDDSFAEHFLAGSQGIAGM